MSHVRMSHVTHTNVSCHTYECVMSHIQMSHVTRTNVSCHTYKWVMSHVRMCHVTHTNESCHTYECVMSHIRMSHVTSTNESCHKYEWVMLNISVRVRRSHVTHMSQISNSPCHTYGDMSKTWLRYVTNKESRHKLQRFTSIWVRHKYAWTHIYCIHIYTKALISMLHILSMNHVKNGKRWTYIWVHHKYVCDMSLTRVTESWHKY